MKPRISFQFTVPLLTLCSLYGVPGHAVEAISPSTSDTTKFRNIVLDEVVVRSFKQQHNLRLEPVSATSIQAAALRHRNIQGIKDFSAMVPNLFMPDYGSKLTSPVYIRGIGSKINAPSVGLYVDGIPYFEKSAFDFEFTEIDKIEVLRGPQGTLYGRNTMGGIINVYTRSPLTYQGTNASLSNGNYGQRDYTLSHYHKHGDRFGWAVSGNYTRNDGFFTNLYTGKPADDLKAGSARLRLEWRPTERLTLGVSTTYDRSDQGGYPYAVCDTLTHRPGQVNYNDYSFYRRSMSTTGFSADYKHERFSINNRTAFQYLSDHQGIDQDFTPKSVYFARQDMKQKMVTEEFNIKSAGTDRYKWLFGAFGFWQGIDNVVTLDYLARQYTTRKYYDTPTCGFALYHQSTFDHLFTKNLSLTLGVRYDFEHAADDYVYYKDKGGETQKMSDFSEHLNFSQITPKIALQYLFHNSGILYATVTKGYKTGGFNTSFDRDEERTFEPETSWNYEIGAKHPFLDNRLSAEVSLFWIDWKNQQIYQRLATQNGQFLRNAGRSESKGVEFSLTARPLRGLGVQMNYGFTHATFKDYKDEIKKIDYSGNALPMVPRHTFSVGADYTLYEPCSWLDRCTFSANYTGTGRIQWKEDNRISQGYYGVLNAKVSAVKDFLTLSLWAKNLTDARYSTYYFETGGNGLAQKGRPLTLGAEVEIHF